MVLPYVFLVLNTVFFVLLLFLVLAFLTGAPYVPSTSQTAKAMITLAQIKKGQTVYDLGSGDGKLLFLAARQGAQTVGIEIHPFLVLLSNARSYFSPYRQTVRTIWKSFWSADLSGADVVFIYLLPWRMEALEKKLKKELAPGALVVSNSFIFPHWKILRQDTAHHVYVFRM